MDEIITKRDRIANIMSKIHTLPIEQHIKIATILNDNNITLNETGGQLLVNISLVPEPVLSMIENILT